MDKQTQVLKAQMFHKLHDCSSLPDLQELARIGVTWVSMATRFTVLALGAADHAIVLFLQSRNIRGLASGFGYGDAQRPFEQI